MMQEGSLDRADGTVGITHKCHGEAVVLHIAEEGPGVGRNFDHG